MANTTPTGPKGFPIPKPPASGATAQDSVTVHVLGFDQITRENFRVKLQAQAALTGGRDAEGLPLGFFLNGILLGKAAFDDFGVADIALTIDWAALQKGKALTVKVKGMEQSVPVQWNAPKSPMELEAEERQRQERARAEQQRREAEECARQEKIRMEEQKRQEKIRLEEQKRQEEAKRQQLTKEFLNNMMNISAGIFWMGATDADIRQFGKIDYELPRHQVKLAAFAISRYPVTQAQWKAVMGTNPSEFSIPAYKYTLHDDPFDDLSRNSYPVENISWHDAQTFCQRLSSMTGQTFRLPTEAEWEYACRAGTETIWYFGNDPAQLGNYAIYNACRKNPPIYRVGVVKPNAWGLFDMIGNVWEWCLDWFDERYYANSPRENPQGPSAGKFRVLRGGAWCDNPTKCRSAFRNGNPPDTRSNSIGFRVACSR